MENDSHPLAIEVEDLDAEVIQGLTRSATEVSEESELVRGLFQACSSQGIDPALEGMAAWVDAALLNEAGTPAVCFGPGSIRQAHSADEWIDTSEIYICADVLHQFIRNFLGG